MFSELGLPLDEPQERILPNGAALLRQRLTDLAAFAAEKYDGQLLARSFLLEDRGQMETGVVLVDATPIQLWPWQVISAIWAEERGPHLVLANALFADHHLTLPDGTRSGAAVFLEGLDRSQRDAELRKLRGESRRLASLAQHLFGDVVLAAENALTAGGDFQPLPRASFDSLYGETIWHEDSTDALKAAIGIGEDGEPVEFLFDSSPQAHALVAGQTGSGKSRLLHALILGLSTRYGPRELQLFVLDYKRGVEFKVYAGTKNRPALPHLQVLGVESDVDFGASVMSLLDELMDKRARLFRGIASDDVRAADLVTYRRATGERLPRVVLVIDECQILLNDDSDAGELARRVLEKIIKQGRSFGVHVVLCSQDITSVKHLARAQFQTRAILRSDAEQARLVGRSKALTLPQGEVIVNDEGEGGIGRRVAVADIEDETIIARVNRLGELASSTGMTHSPFVFEGEVAPDPRDHGPLLASGDDPWSLVLGLPSSLQGSARAELQPESGGNLVIAGANLPTATTTLYFALRQLLDRQPGGLLHIDLINCLQERVVHRKLFDALAAAYPQSIFLAGRDDAAAVLDEALASLEKPGAAPAQRRLIVGLALERANGIDERARRDQQQRLAAAGPEHGVHLLLHYGDPRSFRSQFGDARPFGSRLLFAMDRSDAEIFLPFNLATKMRDYPRTQAALWTSESLNSVTRCRPFALEDTEIDELLKNEHPQVGGTLT